jgi:hypothetical protein
MRRPVCRSGTNSIDGPARNTREREVEDAYKFEAHACMRAQARSIGSDVYSTAEEGTRSDHHRVRTCNNVVLPPL